MKRILLILILSTSSLAQADMTSFLKSCAYGTLGGAAIGLASLAVSENPSSKISNVARGASLGLYAGIAWGFYSNYQQNNTPGSVDMASMYLTPLVSERKIDGAQMNFLVGNF